MADEQRNERMFKRLAQWYARILEQVRHLHFGRHLWMELLRVADTPRIRAHGGVCRWLSGGYFAQAALAVDRQLATDGRSPSLLQLLSAIHEEPQVVTRERYLQLYEPETADALEAAHMRFDVFAMGRLGVQVHASVVAGDMDDLLGHCARVKEHVQNWTAPDSRSLHAVDRALDAICRQTTRYAMLFRPDESPLLPDPTASVLAVLCGNECGALGEGPEPH